MSGEKKEEFLTTNTGVRMADTNNTLKAGERGPGLMQDFHFLEKINHFDHERIPERVVHARGSGAHGYFQVNKSMEKYTKANFLCDTSKKTPVFVRFSTVLGSAGSSDTVRDVRGFATKFYTDEGNFDLVGNNIPVFFIQDAIKFPDIIHAAKPEPDKEVPQAQSAHDNFYDFISLNDESAHMVMWTLSDRAIPRSYRTMQGFGVHTFVLVNKEGQRSFVKFHWIPKLGVHSLVWDEAQKLCGIDPDFHRKDLWEAIENAQVSGEFPEWELGVQIFSEEQSKDWDFDVLDSTKIVPEEKVPIELVGKLVLNRNPDNFFNDTEQVAFCTAHLVSGIETSDDPLLQGRHFSYKDTQITRLGGPNWVELPINRPVCPVMNNQRGGFQRSTHDKGQVNYFPNRLGCPALFKGGYMETEQPVSGFKVRSRGPKFLDNRFPQANLFFNSLSSWEKAHLINAARFELGRVDDQGVRERTIEFFSKIDKHLAQEVAKDVGVKLPADGNNTHSNKSPGVSQQFINDTSEEKFNLKKTIVTRKIAFLIGEGFNSDQVSSAKEAFTKAGLIVEIVGPYKGNVKGDKGDTAFAKWTFLTTKSLVFDGLFIAGGQASAEYMMNKGEAMAFVTEAYKHCKPIIAVSEGVDFLASVQLPGIDVTKSQLGVVTSKAVVDFTPKEDGGKTFGGKVWEAIAKHRHYERDVSKVPA